MTCPVGSWTTRETPQMPFGFPMSLKEREGVETLWSVSPSTLQFPTNVSQNLSLDGRHGYGVSIFGEIHRSPVNGCSVES